MFFCLKTHHKVSQSFFRQKNKRTNYSLCVLMFFCLKTHHRISQSFFRQMNKRTNYSLCVLLSENRQGAAD